jgi:hypothetical protein
MADNDRTNAVKPESNGANARPLDESIAQTERGIPDDSSTPVEISPEEEAAIEKKIRSI